MKTVQMPRNGTIHHIPFLGSEMNLYKKAIGWLAYLLAWPHNGMVLENTQFESPGFSINVPRNVPVSPVSLINPVTPVSPVSPSKSLFFSQTWYAPFISLFFIH